MQNLNNSKKHKVMVACKSKSGEADMFVCEVLVNEDQVNIGEHYFLAESLAEDEGYEGPFVSFDEHEQKNLARQFSKTESPIPFTLEDKSNIDGEYIDSVEGEILFGYDGISFKLKGYSDFHSEDDNGIPIFLDCWEGNIYLRAYADINCEEPTNLITFEKARNSARDKTLNY